MNGFQWAMLILGVLGFVVTWTTGVISLTRAVTTIKQDASEKLTAESKSIVAKLEELVTRFDDKLEELAQRFDEEQKIQDHNTGEMGLALRQAMVDLRNELHEAVIFGRDNYVRIPDFEKAIDKLEVMLRHALDEVKDDIKNVFKGNNP